MEELWNFKKMKINQINYTCQLNIYQHYSLVKTSISSIHQLRWSMVLTWERLLQHWEKLLNVLTNKFESCCVFSDLTNMTTPTLQPEIIFTLWVRWCNVSCTTAHAKLKQRWLQTKPWKTDDSQKVENRMDELTQLN